MVWFTGFTNYAPNQPSPSAATPQQETSSEKRKNAHHDGAGESCPKAQSVSRRIGVVKQKMVQQMCEVQGHEQYGNTAQDVQNSHGSLLAF
jgi:hypothetical protein